MTTWHKGPPPSIGWWPASSCRDKECLRWWDGKHWGGPCYKGEPRWSIEREASHKVVRFTDEIEWTERPASWPERSKT
jgi:hypothetical protein